MLVTLERFFISINRIMSRITSIILLLMIFNVFYDVIMRYFFHNSSVGMQEMEWHLFSLVFLYGISVALMDEGHVRVDFLYERYSQKTKAVVNIGGTILFLLPLALLVVSGSLEYVMDAYTSHEISEDPGGLPYRWVIKAMIPLSFTFLVFTAIGYIIKNINLYRGVAQADLQAGGACAQPMYDAIHKGEEQEDK